MYKGHYTGAAPTLHRSDLGEPWTCDSEWAWWFPPCKRSDLLPHYKGLPSEPGCGCSVCTHSTSLGHRVVRQDTGQHSHGRRVGFPSPRQLFSGPLPITIMHVPAGQPPSGTADRCTLHFLCAFRFRTWGSFLNLAAPSPGPGPTCPRAQSSLAGSCLSGVGSQAPAPLLISVCLAQPS